LTAFHVATSNEDRIMMQLLLEKGADIDVKDNVNGWMALHIAASNGNEAIVRFLLEKGTSVNMKDNKNGWTALYLAAAKADEAVSSALLEAGADIFLEDKTGCTILTRAILTGNLGIVKMFLDTLPGGQDLAIEFNVGSRERENLDLEQQLATLDIRLHHLCEMCSKINFSVLHEKEQCASTGCRYHVGDHWTDVRPFNTEYLEAHSLEYQHHASIDALRVSAQEGCHLCSLMAFCLQHSYERLSITGRESYPFGIEASNYSPAQGPGIVLVYHSSSKWTQKEELEVFCGDLFTVLPVTNIPSKRCSADGFRTGGALMGDGQVNTQAMFFARCVRPNHPVWGHKDLNEMDGSLLGQYPRIQSYMPGQVSPLDL
jgi:hypothetical protein